MKADRRNLKLLLLLLLLLVAAPLTGVAAKQACYEKLNLWVGGIPERLAIEREFSPFVGLPVAYLSDGVCSNGRNCRILSHTDMDLGWKAKCFFKKPTRLDIMNFFLHTFETRLKGHQIDERQPPKRKLTSRLLGWHGGRQIISVRELFLTQGGAFVDNRQLFAKKPYPKVRLGFFGISATIDTGKMMGLPPEKAENIYESTAVFWNSTAKSYMRISCYERLTNSPEKSEKLLRQLLKNLKFVEHCPS